MANEKVITTASLIAKFQKALTEKWGYIYGTAGETWTIAKQESLVNWFVNKYGSNWKNSEAAKSEDKYYGAVYGAKWGGHRVADCSGLFSWSFKELGGYIYHGSNTIWNKYLTNKGKLNKKGRTDGQVLKPGTAVFTGNDSKKPHIGLYIGNDTVIEASGTKAGVITTKISSGKWTYWGEMKGVSYGEMTPVITPIDKDQNAQPSHTSNKKPTLKKGSKGEYVTVLQTMLRNRGYDLGSYGIDGDFGRATESAVKQFQRDNGLTQDGIVGPATWEALEKNASISKQYTVHIPMLTEEEAKILATKFAEQYGGIWISKD